MQWAAVKPQYNDDFSEICPEIEIWCTICAATLIPRVGLTLECRNENSPIWLNGIFSFCCVCCVKADKLGLDFGLCICYNQNFSRPISSCFNIKADSVSYHSTILLAPLCHLIYLDIGNLVLDYFPFPLIGKLVLNFF